MKMYIGCELIEAEPMTRGDYNRFRGWIIPNEENPNDEGYLIKSDEQIRWVIKEYFEKHYLELKTLNEEYKNNDHLTDEIIDLDADTFMGEEHLSTINDKWNKIEYLLGGAYGIEDIFKNKDDYEIKKDGLLDHAWKIWCALVMFAVHGFNYRKGEKKQ